MRITVDGKILKDEDGVIEADRVERDGEVLTGYTGDNVVFRFRGLSCEVKALDGGTITTPEKSAASLQAQVDMLSETVKRLEAKIDG